MIWNDGVGKGWKDGDILVVFEKKGKTHLLVL